MTKLTPKELPSALTSQKGDVLTVYHFGRAPVTSFRPLSHFGTLNAAFERFIQKDILPNGATEEAYLDGAVFYPVHLRIKNPLIVEDDCSWGSNGTTMSTMKHLSPAEQSHAVQALSSSVPDGEVLNELQQAGLYEIDQDPQQNRYNLKCQRVIAMLESKGYDSIAYINREEDSGSVSWVNFRPQQVVGAYCGPLTDQPCHPLQGKPRDWRDHLVDIFSNSAKQPSSSLPLLENARWVTPPDMVGIIVDHFADVHEQWRADQDMREQQFQAEIEIARYDPEYVAARVSNGDTAIADFYERCRTRMIALATTPAQDLPEWQRAYMPKIKQAAGAIQAHPTPKIQLASPSAMA